MEIVDNDKIKSIMYDVSKKNILPFFRNLKSNQINYKNNKDIVTSIDIEVENYLNKTLPQLIKKSNFIGEELYFKNPSILDNYNKSEYCWTVDPIDGTSNFVNGKKKFAIMIALTFKKNIIQSWIYKPLTEDLMYATNKKGTYINGHKVFKIKNKKIVNSTGSISFKYWNKKDQNTIYILRNNFKKINSYGSIGCEYFDIVLGKRDFTILSKLSPWDHIPGVLLVRESGGADCHFDKKRYKFNKKCKNLIVSNSKTLNLEIIKKIKEINHDYK